MISEDTRLQQLIDLSAQLADVNDLDVLLERILTLARQFVGADSGTIYLTEGDRLQFSYAQNETLRKRLAPGKKLIYTTFSVPINHETISGYVASTGESLNIADVYHLPDDVPYHFGRRYDELTNYRTQSMLTLPLRTSRHANVGVLQMINATRRDGTVVPFSHEDERIIAHFANSAALAVERAQMTRTLLLRMISMAELRDPSETGAHVNRVAAYSTEIYETWARARGMAEDEITANCDLLRMAAMLHDAGKVAISDLILKKPGKLTDEEYDVMKTHTTLGARLFTNKQSTFDDAAAEVALNHHERWDGRGYPGYVDLATGEPLPGYALPNGRARGKVGEEIPVFGRVVSVADVYDALRSRRSYKDPMPEEKVLEILTENAGSQFDPAMVDALLHSLDVLHAIADRYPSDEE
jgi:HD-GYP domain-containing protein (c-di-GMP phosphodiesterase class II)